MNEGMNDEQTPQYLAGHYPSGQSSEPAQAPGSGGTEPSGDDRAAQRPVSPGAAWYPEPWVESDPARHWAQQNELTPPAEAAPTQPIYEPPLRAYTPQTRLQGPWRVISAVLLALVLIVGSFLAGRGLTLASQNSASSQGPVAVSTSGSSSSGSSVSSNLDAQQLQAAVVSVAAKVEKSVVTVHSSGGSGSAIGSGEFVTSDGYIATNDHVVNGFSSYSVTLSDGSSLSATLVGEDHQDDLAVLKVNTSNAPAITLADSSAAKVGEFVVAIGSPLGQANSKSFGIVSALNRTETEEGSSLSSSGPILTGLIQTSAALAPGNSGGALVDLDGKMVGMPTLAATSGTGRQSSSSSTIGFAIPSNRVAYVANQLIHSGKLTSTNQGFLGVSTRAAGNGFTSQGVAVAGFTQDAHGATPAQSAGLQVGDVIVAVNGQSIASEEDLAGAVLSRTPGTKISVQVQRGGGQQTIQVTLGERPTNVSA
jgi:S1-C subfamily serine protease